MVRDAINRIGKLDMLVNNAGYGLYGAVEEVSDAELFDQFDTNFFGPWRLCRAVLPGMRSQRSGVIINISSYAGRLPLANGGPYRASKHALEALSGVLHLEVSHFGIRVLNVQLGNVATGFGKSMVNARANSTNGAYAPMQKAVNRIYKKVGARPLSPQKVAQDIVSEAKKERGPYRIVIGDDAKRMIEMSKQEDWVYEKYLVEELGFDWHPLSIAPSNE
jgi:NAD(P)-dependent dehydrogenase (short-subunit alcohol dehydrogenase family)